MEESEYKSFVEAKLAEAKLEVTEKRYQNLWLLFSIVGVAIPIILAVFSAIDARSRMNDQVQIMNKELEIMKNSFETQRKDYNILFTQLSQGIDQSWNNYSQSVNSDRSSLEGRFKELSGEVLKGPNIDCFVNGTQIIGNVFKLSNTQNSLSIEVRNIGDKAVNSLKVTLYANNEDKISIFGSQGEWQKLERSDESGYKDSYRLYYYDEDLSLDPLESKYIGISTEKTTPGQTEITMMLKIHYGQPKPNVFPFKVIVGN